MDPQEELRSHLRPASMVGAAIFATLFVYLGLVEVFRSVLGPFRGFASGVRIQPFRLGAFCAAAAVILLILLLRPRLFGRRGQDDLPAAARRLQKASIVILILGEIPAILGLVLFIAGGNTVDFYKLLLASLVLAFITFPRRAAWEEWLKG
jgi:hypothetical protein